MTGDSGGEPLQGQIEAEQSRPNQNPQDTSSSRAKYNNNEYSQDPRKRPERLDKLDRRISRLTLLVPFLTVLAALYAGYEARRLANLTEQSLTDATRPFVKITAMPDSFTIQPRPNGTAPVMSLNFKIENTGKLPAKPTFIQTGGRWQMEGKPHYPKQFGPTENSIGAGPPLIFSDQQPPLVVTAYGPDLSQGDITDLKSAKYAQFEAVISTWYGPPSGPYEWRTEICNVYNVTYTDRGFRLSNEERCPEYPEYSEAH